MKYHWSGYYSGINFDMDIVTGKNKIVFFWKFIYLKIKNDESVSNECNLYIFTDYTETSLFVASYFMYLCKFNVLLDYGSNH
jgi:hypothetical protein